MISASGLTKRFGGQTVVSDVSFDVGDGAFVALLGPSGGGKSTVLRMVAGLEAPDEGTVEIRGLPATALSVRERELGFVFQNYALFKHMTVAENVGFGLSVRGVPKSEIRKRVGELLELVQLTGYEERRPSELSGGQRQRVALARALAPRPSILLLDEPFGALDAKVRQGLRQWLRSLQREHGIACLFVTHDQEEAMELADQVVVIHQGRVEQIGPPEEVYDRPKTPFVASFIGHANVLSGSLGTGDATLDTAVRASRGEKPTDGRELRAFVRHHEVQIERVLGVDETVDSSRAVGSIRRITRIGWMSRIELALEGGQSMVAELPKERVQALGVVEGDRVSLVLNDASVFVEDYVI